jgi:hypothetical protein
VNDDCDQAIAAVSDTAHISFHKHVNFFINPSSSLTRPTCGS